MRFLKNFVFKIIFFIFFYSFLFSEEILDPSSWKAMKDWLTNPSQDFGIEKLEDGTLDFFVRDTDKGMKWKRDLFIDINKYRWLIVEYRCVNYNSQWSDYIIYLKYDYVEGGIRFSPDDIFKTDGEWHTVIIDLHEYAKHPYFRYIAVQTQARYKPAHLFIKKILFTEKPPEEKSKESKLNGIKTLSIDINPEMWEARRDWLGNPADDFGVIKKEGTLFYVNDPGKGMKWTLNLKERLNGFKWITVKYRAKNINPYKDYFIYLANAPGGNAPQQAFPILLSSLDTNGEWKVQFASFQIDEVKTLAVQIQAGFQPAEVEIKQIIFSDRKPAFTIEDMLSYEIKKEMGKGLVCVPLKEEGISIEEIQKRLSFEGWFKSNIVSIQGITFSLEGKKNFPVVEPKSTITIPLNFLSDCSELYLLLASDLPKWEEASFGGGEMNKIKEIERLKLKLIYEDGDSYEVFPFRLSSSKFEIIKGIDVYGVPVRKKARELQILNGMDNAKFILLALTSSSKPGPATFATALKFTPAIKIKKNLPELPTILKIDKNIVSIEMKGGKLILDVNHGIMVKDMKNNYLFQQMNISTGPLFTLLVGNKKITSESFKILEAIKKDNYINVKGKYRENGIDLLCFLEISSNKEDEISLSLSFKNMGVDNITISPTFPIFREIDIGSLPEDTYYFYPRKGGYINNKDWSFHSYYSANFPLQIMGFFSYQNGGGIYLRTEDLSLIPKRYVLKKRGSKGDMEIEYFQMGIPSYGVLSLPKTIIGFNQGDWKSQLNAYLDWKKIWYKPAVPRKSWFLEVFNFRQHSPFFEVPTKDPIFDLKKKEFHVDDALKSDEELFGGADFIHLCDWAYTPKYGRVGDYDHWEELGGVDNFRKAIELIQNKGIPVGLYIEGYLVDKNSNIGKSKGSEWQILDKNGNPLPFFSHTSYNMCPCLPEWRDYLIKTCVRLKNETGAKGYYIDEFGFAMEERTCWNKLHKHPIPCFSLKGEFDTIKALREALGEDVVLYTEESPVDVASQYQDGSFTYAITSNNETLSPSHLNLYRFVFPDFKTFEIIVCNKALGSNIKALKRIIFNGEGIWLQGMKEWFSEEVLSYIKKYHKIIKNNIDCFTTLSPEPLFPTLIEGVYANMFPSQKEGKKKVIWTIYNTNSFMVEGEIISVEYVKGAIYKDIWNDIEIKPRIVGNKAYLSFRILPQDIVIIRMNE